MVIRSALAFFAVLLGGCQCGFDDSKLEAIACTTEAECPPDRSCIGGYCRDRTAGGEDAGGDDAGSPGTDGGGASDSGIDSGPAPCEDVGDCNDGLDCTADSCVDDFCANVVDEGRCAIDGACWNASQANPANPCEECVPEASSTRWSADDTNAVDDGIGCTVDACLSGVESHAPDDASCGDGEICAPCALGCVARGDVTVECDELPGTPGGDPAHCTASAPSGPEACLSCRSLAGISSLVRQDFDGCRDLERLGWEETRDDGNDIQCGDVERHLGPDIDRNEDAVEIQDGQGSIERTVNTRDLDAVRLCFDYADRDAEETDTLAVDIDTGAGWQTLWTDGGGPFPDVDFHWKNVCLDLTLADPLAADNESLQIRFSANVESGRLFLDNVSVDAWVAGTVTWPGRVFSDDFTGCALGGWAAGGGAVVCPIAQGVNLGRDAVESSQALVSLGRTVDLSARCDDVRMGFSFGTRQFNRDDGLVVSYDRGDGDRPLWASYRNLDPNEALLAFETSLSVVDPEVRFQPALVLDVALEGVGGGGSLYFDDVWLDGAECQSAEDRLVVSAPVETDGDYRVDVSSATRAAGFLECTWAGRPESVGRAPLLFCGNPAECRPGEDDSRSCGQCGSQSRSCGDDCEWSDWTNCNDYPCNCCDAYGNCSACCC